MGYDPFDGITIVLCKVAVNNMGEMNLAMVVSSGIATRYVIASSDVPRGVRTKKVGALANVFTILQFWRMPGLN